jgi:hypothetical protein
VQAGSTSTGSSSGSSKHQPPLFDFFAETDCGVNLPNRAHCAGWKYIHRDGSFPANISLLCSIFFAKADAMSVLNLLHYCAGWKYIHGDVFGSQHQPPLFVCCEG